MERQVGMENDKEAAAAAEWVFEGHRMRVEMMDGEPWFVAKDVCECLGLDNVSQALAGLDEDEKRQLASNIINPDVGGRGTLVVNESGLYSLILRSRKPEAKRFKKWVTSEVLPGIRRHGGYILESKLLEMQRDPRVMAKLFTDLADEVDRRKAAEQARDIAVRTKALIGDRKVATSMATASAAVRRMDAVGQLIGESMKYAATLRVKLALRLEKEPEWLPLRRYCQENGLEPIEVLSVGTKYDKVKGWPAAAWKAVYGIDLNDLFGVYAYPRSLNA